MKIKGLIAAGTLAAATIMSSPAHANRDYISIVGSSTVYPFATVVAEQFGKTTQFNTPVIESTGSGGGVPASGSKMVFTGIPVLLFACALAPSQCES